MTSDKKTYGKEIRDQDNKCIIHMNSKGMQDGGGIWPREKKKDFKLGKLRSYLNVHG